MNIFEIQGPDGTIYEVEAESLEAAASAVSSMGSEGRSWAQALKENLLGDDDPSTQNLGERVGSALNKAGESMTFGLVGDEMSAALESIVPGVDYEARRDHYRQQEEVLERDNPGVALTADIGGALVGTALPLGTMGTLARGTRLAPRVAASTAAGTSAGATYGFMEGEGAQDRVDDGLQGGAIGGFVGAAAPVVGGLFQKGADSLAAKRVVQALTARAPTTEALRAQGQNLYRQIDDAGVRLNPNSVQRAMGDVSASLRDEGLRFKSAGDILPASRAAMGVADEFAREAAEETLNSVPFEDLDIARRAIGHAAGSNLANKGDTRLATHALTSLDDFVRNLGPEDVNAGDVETLKTLLPKARDTWARMSRSQLIDDAIENSENYVSGQASGLANQFKRIVNNPRLRRSFSDAEVKVMRRVIDGTLPEKLLRYLGSGLGMTSQMLTGGAVGLSGGPMGAILGTLAGTATAAGTRRASEAITRQNAEIARALVASGGLESLPVATDQSRRIVESLMRRNAASAPQ